MSVLVISEILRLFLSTLTVDDKDSLHKKKNLPELIQMNLSNKQNNFISIFHSVSEI